MGARELRTLAPDLHRSAGRLTSIAHITTIDLSLKFLLLDQLKAIKEAGFEVTGISAPGPWVGELEAARIRHIPWHAASRGWGVRADIQAAAELARILRREHFDLVHTHNTKPGVMGRVLARLSHVPAVANTVHGLYASATDRRAKKLPVLALERIAAAASDLELYQSEEDYRWARRIGLLGRTRGVLLGNGIDLERFDPQSTSAARRAELRAQLGIPRNALVVGTVARMVAKKGFREFFEMARSIRAAREDVRFIAVGGPDLERGDAISVEEIERARRDVLVTGWQEDARDLIAIMDVFVLASWWGEGKPRSAMEAAAMGKPLVLTDIRGCREVARDSVEGLVIPPRDTQALTSAVSTLLDNPELRQSLGAAARARALVEFDQRRVFDTVIDEYRLLCTRKGIARAVHSEPRLRQARPDDAAPLARLHAQALPNAFMTGLGSRFLRRLYRALARDEDAVCLVAESDHVVVGFACGVTSMRRFKRRFAYRHGAVAGLSIAPRLLKPRVARGVLEDVRYTGDQRDASKAELVSIAIAPSFRSRGLARSLVEGIVSGLGELGATELKVLVAAHNSEANRLYESAGFEPAGRIALHHSVASNVWRVRCRS